MTKKKRKKRILCSNVKTSWQEFCGIGLLFQYQEIGMSHKRTRSSLKKREILFKTTTTKLFQSSVARRTWCDNCISKREISRWKREFQSLIVTKPWCGGLGRIHRKSQAPLMQHFQTSNCFTQSLAWIRWDGKWFPSEVEIKMNLHPFFQKWWRVYHVTGRLQRPLSFNGAQDMDELWRESLDLMMADLLAGLLVSGVFLLVFF